MIRGLTLHRPWAWCIARGSKRIENRGWAPPKAIIGHYIALHAGKTWDYEGAAKIAEAHPEMPRTADAHPLGIVGVARVVGACIVDDYDFKGDWKQLAGQPQLDLSKWTAEQHGRWIFGPFAWVLDDVVGFDVAVPCRGAQGLWVLPSPVLATVRTKWAEARRAA